MYINLQCEDYDVNSAVKCSTTGVDLLGYRFSRNAFYSKETMKKIKEKNYYGIYLLEGQDDNGMEIFYIGQASDLYGRIKNKHGIKDWTRSLIFTAKDPKGLDDTALNYLESRLIIIAKQNHGDQVKNVPNGRTSNPDAGLIQMLDILIGNIRNFAYALGSDAFIKDESKVKLKDKIFYCTKRNSDAKAMYLANKKIKVLKGSKISSMPHNLGGTYKKTIDAMRALYKDKFDGNFVLIEDIIFDKASQASKFVMNYNSDGNTDWKDSNGKPLKNFIKG